MRAQGTFIHVGLLASHVANSKIFSVAQRKWTHFHTTTVPLMTSKNSTTTKICSTCIRLLVLVCTEYTRLKSHSECDCWAISISLSLARVLSSSICMMAACYIIFSVLHSVGSRLLAPSSFLCLARVLLLLLTLFRPMLHTIICIHFIYSCSFWPLFHIALCSLFRYHRHGTHIFHFVCVRACVYGCRDFPCVCVRVYGTVL